MPIDGIQGKLATVNISPERCWMNAVRVMAKVMRDVTSARMRAHAALLLGSKKSARAPRKDM
jgi:hypothetical protein